MNEKPKLRQVQAVPYDSGGERLVCLRDPSGVSRKTVVLPMRAFFIVSLMDGQHALRDIQAEYLRRFGDLILIEKVEEMARQLDEALMLEGERFEAAQHALAEEFARAPSRKAAFAGTAYPARPQALMEQFRGFFTHRQGPGEMDRTAAGTDVCAIAAPHIDFKRGGPAYAHAYKALAERCPAEIFVILGTAHATGAEGPFIVTDKHFETPMGIVQCDRAFARELMRRAWLSQGPEELLHRGEHSIEFQAVFLRHVFGTLRPARIVPVLCGPILERVGDAPDPLAVEPIGRFAAALKGLLAEYGERAAVIASVDLSHVGRQFGQDITLSAKLLESVESGDRALLAHAEKMDAAGFFDHNRRDGDRRNVCGFPALYVLLASIRARRGQLLHYAQAPDRGADSVVSFAAMAFERA